MSHRSCPTAGKDNKSSTKKLSGDAETQAIKSPALCAIKKVRITWTAAYADYSDVDYSTKHHSNTVQETGKGAREPFTSGTPVVEGFATGSLDKSFRRSKTQKAFVMNEHTDPAPYDKMSIKDITPALCDSEDYEAVSAQCSAKERIDKFKPERMDTWRLEVLFEVLPTAVSFVAKPTDKYKPNSE